MSGNKPKYTENDFKIFLKNHNCKWDEQNWLSHDNNNRNLLTFECENNHINHNKRFDSIKNKLIICPDCLIFKKMFESSVIKGKEKGYDVLKIFEQENENYVEIKCINCSVVSIVKRINLFNNKLNCKNCITIDKKLHPNCSICKEDNLTENDFCKDKSLLSGLSSSCKDCSSYQQHLLNKRYEAIIKNFIECQNCKCFKKLYKFNENKKICKFCEKNKIENEQSMKNIMNEVFVELNSKYLLKLNNEKKQHQINKNDSKNDTKNNLIISFLNENKCSPLSENWIIRENGRVYVSYKCNEFGHENIERKMDSISKLKNICSECVKLYRGGRGEELTEEYIEEILIKNNCVKKGDKWFYKEKGKTYINFTCKKNHDSIKRYDCISNKDSICDKCNEIERFNLLLNNLLIKIKEKNYKLLNIEDCDKEFNKKTIEIECLSCSSKKSLSVGSFLKNKTICFNCK